MKLNVNLFNDHEYCFYNKKPTYSKRFKSYVINYINRCIKTSIKNFQLIDLNEYLIYLVLCNNLFRPCLFRILFR
jgi:hypothetical protein